MSAADAMPVERLFLSLILPEAVREHLTTLFEPLPGVQWTRPDQLHVTLRFLGEVEDALQQTIAERLSEVRVEPFILPLEGLGTFPPNRPPRVLWIGVGSGHPRLFQLRQRLDGALLATGLPLDVRTFHPHVTLGRASEEAARAVGHWLHTRKNTAAPSFLVDRFALMRSELRPSGAVHTEKRIYPLAP